MRFLPSAFSYNPLLPSAVDAKLAAQIVWLDAYTLNVDRTVRNTNLLLWQKELWLIDHGAAVARVLRLQPLRRRARLAVSRLGPRGGARPVATAGQPPAVHLRRGIKRGADGEVPASGPVVQDDLRAGQANRRRVFSGQRIRLQAGGDGGGSPSRPAVPPVAPGPSPAPPGRKKRAPAR